MSESIIREIITLIRDHVEDEDVRNAIYIEMGPLLENEDYELEDFIGIDGAYDDLYEEEEEEDWDSDLNDYDVDEEDE
jgi:hypothetical protein